MFVTKKLAKSISNYGNQDSIGAKLRAKRLHPLMQMIQAVFNECGSVSIVDIGGTETYWSIVPAEFLAKNNVSITIVNLPGTVMPKDHSCFSFIVADGCDLQSFDDSSFDIAHSNSVLEHVGDWVRMVQFAGELSRVSKKYFVQTPNYWFPIEPHCMTPFFHWLPKPIRVWLVAHFQLGHWSKSTSIDQSVRIVESARLLNKKMFRELFNDAHVLTERIFWLPKSFVAIKR